MNLSDTLKISASGMAAQSTRLRVIAENLANADTTGATPGAKPYQRQTVTFGEQVDQASGVPLVTVTGVRPDTSAFPLRYDPANPAANAQGYVRMPNVNMFAEMTDMRQAQRSYDANLEVMQIARGMLTRAIGILK